MTSFRFGENKNANGEKGEKGGYLGQLKKWPASLEQRLDDGEDERGRRHFDEEVQEDSPHRNEDVPVRKWNVRFSRQQIETFQEGFVGFHEMAQPRQEQGKVLGLMDEWMNEQVDD